MINAYKKKYECPYCGEYLKDQGEKLVCNNCAKEFYSYEKLYLKEVM